jgi:hypothetical protein
MYQPHERRRYGTPSVATHQTSAPSAPRFARAHFLPRGCSCPRLVARLGLGRGEHLQLRRGSITGSYVVGDGPEWRSVPSSTSHGGLLPRITAWLREVKRDIETPDKWAELQKKAQLLSAASDSITENSPFTSFEQNQIADQLRVMVERAQRTYSLSAAQTKALNEKLDYVAEASHRLGRKDWFLLLLG